MAYGSCLLSTLVPILYEETIDDLNDLDNSGLPLLVVKGSAVHDYISHDPSPLMKRIFNRTILLTIEGGVPQWPFDM